ncbi:lysylphosphatidylglycerol synthase domain-containing protein [Salinibacterium sp. ZJ450]|uniref:lysylphosphatidylglycerol synthase domain-containing protein n=1 Tax=Salinibacterium sp. ZJ450 TaxID=2708338 RepID=UPI00141F9B37|nr:lysylphosphatidylglycerol synthase domain-containing protein [Salinibacterium sp. ZJ450]
MRRVLTVVVLIAVAWFFATALAANWNEVSALELQLTPYVGGAVALFAVAVLVSGVLWGLIVNSGGGIRVSTLDAIAVHCSSWLLKYVPGQIGSLVNKVDWGHRRSLSRTQIVIGFVYENVFLQLASLIPGAVIVFFALGPQAFESNVMLVAVPLLAIIPLLATTNRRLFAGGMTMLTRRFMKRDIDDSYFLGSSRTLAIQLGYLVPRIINGMGFLLVAASVVELTSDLWLPLAAAYTLGGAVGILAVFVPSGLGVREAVVVAIAASYMPLAQAIVIALLARLYSTVADALVALAYGGIRLTQKKLEQ